MADPKPPTRQQLAKICNNDPDAIRILERLFIVAGKVTPDQLAEIGTEIDAVLALANANQAEIAGIDASLDWQDSLVFVNTKSDLPTAIAGVIYLVAGVTYFFTTIVDLEGDRIVSGANTTILGTSSENSGIKSTGLVGSALITSEWSLPMRHLQLDAQIILDLDAGSNADQALDWYAVNLLGSTNIGTIANYANFVASSMAFLNSSGLVFDGTVGTIGFINTFLTASVGTIITIAPTATIGRRFRASSTSFVATGTATAIDFSASATAPDESFILDNVNFSGGGTYVSGVIGSDNKALFVNCRGVKNSSSISNYHMNANATATVIAAASVPVKISGATTSGAITERFTNTANRATYTGALTRTFLVTAGVTFTGTTNDVGAVYIAKNGAIVAQSAAAATANAGGRAENVPCFALIEMIPTDYVEVWIENRTGARNFTITDINVIVEARN